MAAKNVFKISFTIQLKALLPLIIVNGGLLCIYIYFFGLHFESMVFWVPFSGLLLFSIIPTLALHINYLAINHDSVLKIISENQTLNYYNSKTTQTFSFNEIESLEYTGSYGKNTGFYTFEGYSYCVIIIKDKPKIIITSLMKQDPAIELEKVFKIKSIRKFKILPFT